MMLWVKKSNLRERSYSFFYTVHATWTRSCWKGFLVPIAPTKWVGPTFIGPHHFGERVWKLEHWPVKPTQCHHMQTRYPIFGGIKLPTHIIGAGESSRGFWFFLERELWSTKYTMPLLNWTNWVVSLGPKEIKLYI